jgi:hypothetical protein
MQEIYVEKPALSKKRSYVLKTSVLQTALADAKIDCHMIIRYWTPQIDNGSVLEGEYWLPNQNVPYARVYIRAGSLPKAERRDAFRWLERSVLPSFIQWLTKVLALPDNSPILSKGASFRALYRFGVVEISHDFS